MRTEKLWEICMDIYRDLYKHADPSADFDELIKSGETQKEGWFYDYYMPEEKIDEIIEKHLKEHRLSKWEKHSIRTTIYLGSSPTSVRRTTSKLTKH